MSATITKVSVMQEDATGYRAGASLTLTGAAGRHGASAPSLVWPLFTPLPEDTELVAFGVCQYHPRLITLANVNTPSAMSKQTSHLGGLVIRPEIEVQAALGVPSLI
jgi:hypothetical protein